MHCILVELVFVLQKVAGDNVTVEIRNILKEVDRNGDGRIDYEEFCDMMRQVTQISLLLVATLACDLWGLSNTRESQQVKV